MIEFVKSRTTLLLGVSAAALAALGYALVLVGDAVISEGGSSATQNLVTAGSWIVFVGVLAALAGVGHLAWKMMLEQRWNDIWEVAGATVATLLLAIGHLLAATEVTSGSNSGAVVAAIGYGGWALVALGVAARRSVAEHKASQAVPQSVYWIVAAVALVLVAVGTGLPPASFGDSTPEVVGGILAAIGIGGILAAIVAAKARGQVVTQVFGTLAASLGLLSLAKLGVGISSAIIYSASTSLTELKIGSIIPLAIEVIGFIVLAVAAFQRSVEVPQRQKLAAASPSGGYPGMPQQPAYPAGYPGMPQQPAGPPGSYPGAPRGQQAYQPQQAPFSAGGEPVASTGPSAPATAACPACGNPLQPGTSFCTGCGTPIAQ